MTPQRGLFIILFLLIAFTSIVWAKEKVILDTDMVELYDDGVAMMMLANSEEIDLLGIVTVSGNVWAAEATSYALRQLEIIGRPDIPVYAGDIVKLKKRLLELKEQYYDTDDKYPELMEVRKQYWQDM